MKRLIYLMSIATITLTSCMKIIPATGEIIEQTIAIDNDIYALAISNNFDVRVDPTLPQGEVRVTTNSGMMEHLNIYTEEATLIIGLKPTMLYAKTLLVRIPDNYYNTIAISGGANLKWDSCNVPSLTLAASGGTNIEITATCDNITLAASGGSDVEMTATSSSITIATSGGSDAEFKGTTSYLSISASGGSDVDCIKLVAEDAEVAASGGSDVDVYATNSLNIHASGGADVRYGGNPTNKDIYEDGGADVKPAR